MNKELEERVIRSKGTISAFAVLLGLFCLINSILTVYVNKVDIAGTAELKSGYMVNSLAHKELWNKSADIFKYGGRVDVRTEAEDTKLIADIINKAADSSNIEIKEISIYNSKGRLLGEFKNK